jgi:hypothetical protein
MVTKCREGRTGADSPPNDAKPDHWTKGFRMSVYTVSPYLMAAAERCELPIRDCGLEASGIKCGGDWFGDNNPSAMRRHSRALNAKWHRR